MAASGAAFGWACALAAAPGRARPCAVNWRAHAESRRISPDWGSPLVARGPRVPSEPVPTMRIPILALLLLLVATALPSAASAAVDLRRVDSSLVDLPFGGGVDDVATWVKSRLERVYAPRIKAAVDDNDRARLRAQLEREVFEFRSALIAFDGRRTGYEVSPVAGEFMVGSDESMLVLKDRGGDHFFFFIGGRLWKYGRLLTTENPFADRLASQAHRLGAPERVETSRGRGETATPIKAVWSDDRLELRLWNRRLLYGYDVMFIDFRALSDRIAELRGGRQATGGAHGVDPDLEGFLLDDDEDEEERLRERAP